MNRNTNKASKKAKKKAATNDDDDEQPEEKVRTVKVPLKKIVRKPYQKVILPAIREKALMATKICHLSSLLFLYKVQTAIETHNIAFFEKRNNRPKSAQNTDKTKKKVYIKANPNETSDADLSGYDVINGCFHAVLETNINAARMEPAFRAFVESLDDENRFDWPNSAKMGNAMNDIVKQYVDNLKTTLYTNRKKRLREYLRMRVYKNNQNPHRTVHYEQSDINNAIGWAIHGNETIKVNHIDYLAKRQRRDGLLEMIRENSWFVIEHTNVSRYTKNYWYASIQMWISMQREIDAFNTDHQQRTDRMEQRRQMKQPRRRNRKNQQQQQQPQPQPQPEKSVSKPPKVKNLAVIPICDIKRMHYPIDNYTLYMLLCGAGIVPKCESKRRVNGIYERNITQNEFLADNQRYWNEFFHVRKIKYFVRYKKNFRFRMLSDGIAVSLQYDIDEEEYKPLDNEEVVRKYNDGEIPGEAGLDPGDKTWIAFVYRDVQTGKEVNVTFSSKQYHWLTQQQERNRKATRWTKDFDEEARADRNSYPMMPSDMGANWWDYIRHRLKTLKKGMEVYASDKYTRLNLDKYIISNRVCDNVANMVTNKKPCLVHLGNAEMSPNRPIRIKKHMRCPGQRKLLRSFKKCPNCFINITDEYYTSQTCAKCFKRFDKRTKSHRFKVCTDCTPDPRAMLPSMIVGRKSKRMRRLHSLLLFLMEKELEDRNGNQMVGDAEDPNQLDTESLLSKVMIYRKNWLVNPVTGVLEHVNADRADFNWETYQGCALKTVWDRDTVAAKCILIKGHCGMFNDPLPETLRRPPPPWLGDPVAN